ncbi:MAG: choice-of-anchor D domain-containing protein [Bacteroidota bacterium]
MMTKYTLRLLFSFFSFLIIGIIQVSAQIAAGDIAIIGMNGGPTPTGPNLPLHNDEFSIVALADLPGNTDIKITDYPSNGMSINLTVAFSSFEGIITWTTPSGGITAGTVITFSISSGGNTLSTDPNTGIGSFSVNGWTNSSVTGSPMNNVNGENIIIYTGTEASPNYIYGFLNSSLPGDPNASEDWQTSVVNPQASILPTGLLNSDGTNVATAHAMSFGGPGGLHRDNMVYSGPKSGTRDFLLTEIGKPSNWTTDDANPLDLSIGGTNWTGTNPVFNLGGISSPQIAFNPTPTDLGTIPKGNNTSQAYIIENTGSATLTITSITSSNSPTFIIQNMPISVVASTSATFEVVFSPSVTGTAMADITITSNASNSPIVMFTVNGTGVIPQSEFYVKTSGNDSNTGADFNNAYQTLQKALEEAEAFGTGAKIYVAGGTYKPSQGWDISTGLTTTMARFETFRIPDGVEVYGGFVGTEVGMIDQTVFDARDFVVNETILSGDLNDDDIVTGTGITLSFNNTSENVYHVVYTKNISSATIINGFTIKGANANGTSPNNRGGGWYNDGNGAGGNSSGKMINCVFTENNAFAGAGLYNDGSEGESSPNIRNCRFERNDGGGIYNSGLLGVSSPDIINCIFLGNNSGAGAGIVNSAGSGGTGICRPRITNCSFTGNVGQGAGMYNIGGATSVCNPVVTNSIFWANVGAGKSWANVNASLDISFSMVEEADQTEITSGNYVNTIVGAGMIYAQDPLFTNAASGTLTLEPCSPAIDKGSSSSVTIFKDLADEPRIQNGEVDLGAYEFDESRIPEINFTPLTTAFGLLVVGESATLTYSIENTASGTLTISSVSSNQGVFSVRNISTPLALSTGTSTTFEVSFTPITAGLINATITINSDDCDESVIAFSVSGTGFIPASITASVTETCPNTSVSLTASSGDGYLWSTGETTQSIFVSPNVPTTYSVTVTTSGVASEASTTIQAEDNEIPTVMTQNINLDLNPSGDASITAAIINNGSTDNCGIVPLSLDKTDFTCADLGTNTITLTATDAAGNSATGTAIVTVRDLNLPEISLAVTPDQVNEDDDLITFTFTFTRTSVGCLSDLTVNFTVGGDATYNDDYYLVRGADTFTNMGGTVTIPAGQTSAQVVLQAQQDAVQEGDEMIILTIDNP